MQPAKLGALSRDALDDRSIVACDVTRRDPGRSERTREGDSVETSAALVPEKFRRALGPLARGTVPRRAEGAGASRFFPKAGQRRVLR